MKTKAFIGIGSNLDDPIAQVKNAIDALGQINDARLSDASRLYRNPPMGPVEQPDYVNAVAALETGLSAEALLAELQRLEAEAGRKRNGVRWGPRPLDLDLLLYGEVVIDTPLLQVPHAGIPERAFVLYPLAEIAPDVSVPGMGPIGELLAGVSDDGLAVIG